MGRALRAEILKLGKRPAVWVMLAVLVVTHVLFGYFFLYMVRDLEAEGLAVQAGQLLDHLLPRRIVGNALGGVAGTGGALVLILSVLAFGSEYRWGTLKTIATQGPSRLTLGGGKLAALAIVALLFTAAYFVTALVCSVVIASLEGAPVVFPRAGAIVAGLGAGWLILLTWGALGLFLAVALRGTGLTIGLVPSCVSPRNVWRGGRRASSRAHCDALFSK